MEKKYLAKIIATENEGLQMISACCAGAKVKISDIKFLKSNKIFLLSVERKKIETNQKDKKINSICKFEFVDQVKSKNIDQNSQNILMELLAIDVFKKDHNFEITLLFSKNRFITLSTEVIEVTLEDQKFKDDKNN